MSNHPIIIIGGGLSGLYLADLLQQNQQPFILLEARQSLGGRICSESGYDLGPTWYWPGQLRMQQLQQRFQLQQQDQFAQGDTLFQQAEGISRVRQGYDSPNYRIAGGMGQLVDALAKGLPSDQIFTDTPVSNVRRQDDHIVVIARQQGQLQNFKASAVVLALPPRLIPQHIGITPAFADATKQVLYDTPTWMAGQAKAVIRYPRAFWRDFNLSGLAISHVGPLAEIHDASPNHSEDPESKEDEAALFGFIGIPPQERRRIGKEALQQAIVQQLTALFGEQAQHPSAVTLRDWAEESYTATPLDQQPLNYHPQYGLPEYRFWNNRLFLAGAESIAEFGGYLEGALASSERVFTDLKV